MHVQQAPGAKSPSMVEFAHGPNITSVRNAMRKIVQSEEVKRHDYELRLLSIPALSVEAVWLTAKSKTDDLLVPYMPAPGLRKLHFYTVEEFVRVLRSLAQRQLSFNNAPRKPGSA
jgi:hypothetical protein